MINCVSKASKPAALPQLSRFLSLFIFFSSAVLNLQFFQYLIGQIIFWYSTLSSCQKAVPRSSSQPTGTHINMGHYGDSKRMRVDVPSSSDEDVFHQYKKHCGAARVNTDLAIIQAIRDSHPDTNVTCINAYACELVDFAKAGHGTTTLKHEKDNYQARRKYRPPPTRLDGGVGTLEHKIDFGFYEAEFFGHSFQFYRASWKERYSYEMRYLILSPKSSADANGNTAEIDELLLAASKWTSELHDEIYVFDAGMWTKNQHLWAAVQNSSWDDVILDPNMKETLISDVQNFFDSRSLYEEYAVPWKRGIIFHGTPGCGKTISVKALMNSLYKRDPPVASLYVKSFKTCQGEEYSIREIFSKARNMAPCLLILEDLDSLVVDRVRSYFLNEVDGLEDNNGILMIGSTNHLERLDHGISKRPSRFDRKYHYKIPGQRERVLYCEYWKKKLEKNSNVDFDPAISEVVAKLTDGFSFAYLKELFVQTLLTIVGGRAHEVENKTLEETAEEAKVVENSARLAVREQKVESTAKEGEDATSKEKAIETAEAAKPEMPSVEIPESLKSNPLMRVLHKQAIALWKDMDNTKDEEAGVKKFSSKSEDDEGGCGCD